MNNNKNLGVTLIELVMAIVVISIGLTALLATIIHTTSRSADPMVQQQAIAIAQSYMEEILAEPFCDWNDLGTTDCYTSCTSNACSSCTGGTIPGGAGESRSTYDDVCDFNGINEAAADITGPITDLADYTVEVTVIDTDLNFNGLVSNSGQVVQIDVGVTHSTGFSANLTTYKANY